jgi:hypothetical protein
VADSRRDGDEDGRRSLSSTGTAVGFGQFLHVVSLVCLPVSDICIVAVATLFVDVVDHVLVTGGALAGGFVVPGFVKVSLVTWNCVA